MTINDWMARIARQNADGAAGATATTTTTEAAEAAEASASGDAGGVVSDLGGAGGDQPADTAAPSAGAADPFSGFSDPETAAWLKKKGFDKNDKPYEAIATSLRHLEKRLGAGPDRLLVKPDENSSEEVKEAWRAARGIPKEVGEYEVAEGFSADDPIFQGYAKAALEAGVSNEEFKVLQQRTAELAAEQIAAEENTFNAVIDRMQAETPQQLEQLRAATARRGVTPDELAKAMTGPVDQRAEAYLAILQKMAGGLAEQRNPIPDDAGERRVGMDAQQAQEKIDRLMNDDAFQKRYRSPNTKTREQAFNEVLALRKIIADARSQS